MAIKKEKPHIQIKKEKASQTIKQKGSEASQDIDSGDTESKDIDSEDIDTDDPNAGLMPPGNSYPVFTRKRPRQEFLHSQAFAIRTSPTVERSTEDPDAQTKDLPETTVEDTDEASTKKPAVRIPKGRKGAGKKKGKK